jgi:D-amino-acid dehydrogenase
MAGRSDVLVIGGGVIGACVTRALSEQGARVTLLERELAVAPPVSAVHANCGLIVPHDVTPLAEPGALGQGLRWMLDSGSPFYIRPRASRRLLRWLWLFRRACAPAAAERSRPLLRRLQMDSADEHERLARRRDGASGVMGTRWHYRHNGLLQVYETPAGLRAGLAEARHARRFGVPVEVLDAEGARQRMPGLAGPVEGATFFPEDAHLDPAAFTREMVSFAEGAGAEIVTGAEALRLDDRGAAVSVLTTRGSYEAAQVVLAAGAWTPALARDLGAELPVEPAKGYSVDVARPAGFPELPLFLADAHAVLTPLADALRVGSTLELAGWDMTVRLNRVAGLRRAASRAIGLPEDGPLRRLWRAPRPVTPDGLPLIGRLPQHPRVVLATGHCMIGLSLGPVTGRLVAELCGGAPSPDMRALAPDRFAHLGGGARSAAPLRPGEGGPGAPPQ